MTKGLVLCGFASFVLLASSALAARADQLDDIMKSGTIRVATDVAVPPAGMMNAQMQPIGSDVETAQLLAKDWGLKLEFVPTTKPTRIPNVLSGKADIIISTLSVTPERMKVIDFSRAYAVQQSVVGGGPALRVSGIAGLRGMSVAVTRGTTQDIKLTALADANGFTVHRYDSNATLVAAGATGHAQLIAASVALVEAVEKKNPASGFATKFVLGNSDVAIGLKNNQPKLLAKLNDWVWANLQNGMLNAIYKKYFKADLPASMRPPEVH